MSFWPFPKKLLDQIRRGAEAGPSVELGVGRAALRDRLEEVGVRAVGLDVDFGQLRTIRGDRICADARLLPLRPRGVGLLTAGNLLRHLDEVDRAVTLAEARGALRDGGRLVVLEDAVEARNESEENYRRCLELLARAGGRRSGVIAMEAEAERAREAGLDLVDRGAFENRTPVRDPHAPLRWLEESLAGDGMGGELRKLAERVKRSGMSYGRAQYLVFGPERGR